MYARIFAGFEVIVLCVTDIPWLMWRFVFGSIPIIFGLPFFFVAGASLYSKLLPMQVQGMSVCNSARTQ